MENIVITPNVADIQSLRLQVGEAVKSEYGAMRRYAEALCAVLPAEWYLVEHNDKGEHAKPVHAEKKALFEVLKAAEHKNPSTIWARVRKYAQEHIEGVPEVAEGEADGNARHARPLDQRLIEDLISLWKACNRAESLSDKHAQCKTHIGSALTAMGVDLSMIE